MTQAIVTSITQEGTKKIDDMALHFIPVACYAYTVGENTMNNAKATLGL